MKGAGLQRVKLPPGNCFAPPGSRGCHIQLRYSESEALFHNALTRLVGGSIMLRSKQLSGNAAMLGLVCLKFSACVLPFPFRILESGLGRLVCTEVFLRSDCVIPS